MIASLLLAGYLIQGGAPVTFSEPAAPLKHLMPKLAEACHQAIKVHPTMEREVLCVAVHDVPAKELLARVAAATGGLWVTENNVSTLEPDSAARSAIVARGLVKRTARMQHFLDEFEKVQSQDWDPGAPKRAEELTHDSRVHLLFRVANAIGAKALASVFPGGRVVYSSSPTNGQFALNGDMSAEVAAYIKDYARRRRSRGLNEQPQADPVVSKINAIVACQNGNLSYGNNTVTIAFELYDSKGGLISEDSEQLDNEGIEAADPPSSKDAESKKDEPLMLSPDAKQFSDFLTVDFQHETHGMRPAAVAKILIPDKVDPLSYPAELFAGAAGERGLQLVASLPDDVFGWFEDSAAIKTPKDVFDRLDTDLSILADQKDNWLTISPSDFTVEPVDREDLKKLATAYNGKHDVTLGDLMQLATYGVGTAHGMLVQIWIGDICPMLVDLVEREDWDVLRLCAAAPDVTLQKLMGGNPTTVLELGSGAQGFANALVFGVEANYDSSEVGLLKIVPPKTADDGDKSSEGTDDAQGPEDYRAEPTEVVPNGLPGSAPIKVTTESETVMRPAGQTEYSGEQQSEMAGSTPDELGQEAAVVNRDFDHVPYRITSIDYDHELTLYKAVQIGIRVTYHFRIYVTAEAFRDCKIVIPSFTAKETYTLQTLPAELQNAFDAAVKDAKESAKRQLEREAKNNKAPP